MANITNNRISAVLTEEQIAAIKAHLAGIATEMPFLLGLTAEERIRLPKIDVANRNFVKDALTALRNNPGLLPDFINVAEMEKDLILFEQLDELLLLANGWVERLRDTQILAGSEAYSSALFAYRIFQIGADAGLPGADTIFDLLKERFAGQGSSGNNTTPPPQP